MFKFIRRKLRLDKVSDVVSHFHEMTESLKAIAARELKAVEKHEKAAAEALKRKEASLTHAAQADTVAKKIAALIEA